MEERALNVCPQKGRTKGGLNVDTEIRVTMLGKFTIYGPGLVRPRVISLTGRSKRLWNLIAYLILHRDRGVPAQELIETFWSNGEGVNPLSTLQNNISRARNALEELGMEDGKRLIHNNSGTYFWAPNRRTYVDCEQFDEAAKLALSCRDTEQGLAMALAAAKLYTADFLPDSAGEGWCMGLGPSYRQTYMTLCRKTAEELMEAGRFREAGELCQKVVHLEPVAEDFSCLYMHAVIMDGDPQKALDYYAGYCAQLKADYGVAPTAKLEAERLLAQEKIDGGVEKQRLEDFLKADSHQEGAFRCDSDVFREIVNRHLRDMRRSGTPAQILVFRLENEDADPEKRAKYMCQMEETLLRSLRAGDPFTRGGMALLLALLPGASGENGPTVVGRIMGHFHREYPQSKASFDIQILDLGTMGQGWEGKKGE